jgi:hypothetical protein
MYHMIDVRVPHNSYNVVLLSPVLHRRICIDDLLKHGMLYDVYLIGY